MKKRHISRILYYIIISLVISDHLSAMESSFYTVPLKKFSRAVFSQDVSKYRIILKDSEFVFPDTVNQRVLSKKNENNSFILFMQSGYNNIDPEKDGLKKYLNDSILLNLDDPGIQRIKAGFKSLDDVIGEVEKFVYGRINNKMIGIPLTSASEILKKRAGDCTEHTVLAVSLLRSLGIPARALVGMLLCEEFEGSRNVFVYHMWAEAFTGGKWVLVDAANPGKKHHNRYIAFAYHHLQTETPLAYLKAVSAMKNFTVEYAGE